MKKAPHYLFAFCFVLSAILFANISISKAQSCNNVDFENGTLSGWTGTWGNGRCVGGLIFGLCVGCYTPDPFQYNGFAQGANDQAANAMPVKSHFIMTSGVDPFSG